MNQKTKLTKKEEYKSTEYILKIIAITDLLECELLDYTEFLKSCGDFRYDRKMLINRILKDCRSLSKENDKTIGIDKASEFGEIMDLMRESINKIFKECIKIGE